MSKSVIVLGNHRCGSSCVSSILVSLGVNMGEELLGSHPSNPGGHFEDMEWMLMQDDLIGDWMHPVRLERSEIGVARIRYARMIKDRNKKFDCWGVKDPRNCITLDYFYDLLYDPRIINVERDLNDIAMSLNDRDGMGMSQARRIATRYDREKQYQLKNTVDCLVMRVRFKDLLDNPVDIIRDMRDFVGTTDKFPGLQDDDKLKRIAEHRVKRSYVHHG